MSTDEAPVQVVDDEDPEEYNVEAIRAKRRNPKTNGWEYLIKWENYKESENTWEPSEHLKCPDIIQKFEEAEKNKRRRKKAERVFESNKRHKSDQEAGTSRASTNGIDTHDIFIERSDDDDDDDAETRRKNRGPIRQPAEVTRISGFDRGLKIHAIISAAKDETGKLWFVVKWESLDEVEFIPYDEMKSKASQELNDWYTQRLYWSINEQPPK